MLPVTILNIEQAFSEISQLGCDQWENDDYGEREDALRDILEPPMNSSIDAYLA